jgi:E3 SUMO-protein ligase NSE2
VFKRHYLIMAVSKAARRGRSSLRREPSDVIEDDPSQQAAQNSNDEDDIEAPPPTRAPKGKRGQPSTSAGTTNTNPDMLAELGDPPIERVSASKLMGMSEDWKRMRETIHGNSYALVRDVAATMAEFAEDEQGQKVCSFAV